MSDQPKTWHEMTDAEKGALLLAEYEGKEIEKFDFHKQVWEYDPIPFEDDGSAFRIKPVPEPVVEVRRIPIASDGWPYDADCHDEPAYEFIFDMIDGKADRASVKMEKI